MNGEVLLSELLPRLGHLLSDVLATSIVGPPHTDSQLPDAGRP